MQPRILIREQGQNKKRFISPTEIKNNQIVYGDPLGRSKIPIHVQPASMTSDKVFSPENRRSILEIEKQESQKRIGSKIAVEEGKRQSENSSEKRGGVEAERFRSIGQSSRPEPQSSIQNAKSTSKTKPSSSSHSSNKKDYMMSTLAKLNRNTKSKQSDNESNSSQSRSKINSIRGQKQKRTNDTQQEYAKKNVYNHKQKDGKRRLKNKEDESQASSRGSEEGFSVYGENFQSYVGISSIGRVEGQRVEMKQNMQMKQPERFVDSHKSNAIQKAPVATGTISKNLPNQYKQPQSTTQNVQSLSKQKYSFQGNDPHRPIEQSAQFQQYRNQPPLKFVKKPSNQENHHSHKPLLSPRQGPSSFTHAEQHQQKPSFTSSPSQQRAFQQLPQHHQQRHSIEDSNNSSLAIHLKKAHQEKQQLRQKKLSAQRSVNDLKHLLSNEQQTTTQLRKQLQSLQVHNLSLTSQIKSLRQTENMTKHELHGTNERNQAVYHQLVAKYDHLMEEYKKAMMGNDSLVEESERMRVDCVNFQKRVGFLETRIKQMEIATQEKEHQHMQEIRRTVEEWKGNVERLEKEIIKYQQEGAGENAGVNGGTLGQLKIKLIEYETEMDHKAQLLQKRDEEIRSIKKQHSMKTQDLEQMLFKKDKELKEMAQEIAKHQRTFAEKSMLYQTHMKQLQVKLAKVQKDLHLKKIELQQASHKLTKSSSLTQQVEQIYNSGIHHPSKQTTQAKHSLESIVSDQTNEVNHYKKSLNLSITQNFTLKSQLQQLRAENNNLSQELNILRLQYSALEKKQSQSVQTEVYVVRSQLETALRKQKELEQKLEAKSKEVKEKDQFIQGQLVARGGGGNR